MVNTSRLPRCGLNKADSTPRVYKWNTCSTSIIQVHHYFIKGRRESRSVSEDNLYNLAACDIQSKRSSKQTSATRHCVHFLLSFLGFWFFLPSPTEIKTFFFFCFHLNFPQLWSKKQKQKQVRKILPNAHLRCWWWSRSAPSGRSPWWSALGPTPGTWFPDGGRRTCGRSRSSAWTRCDEAPARWYQGRTTRCSGSWSASQGGKTGY